MGTYNNQPTFYRKGIKPCIDFIISNCPTKISNVRTHYNGDDIYQYKDTNYHNIMSDHIMTSCSYNNKKIRATQQFRTIRDYKLLTKHTLNEYFSHNDTLNTIFNYTDPEIVANVLINEITLIINCIAPPKKIQCSNNYAKNL